MPFLYGGKFYSAQSSYAASCSKRSCFSNKQNTVHMHACCLSMPLQGCKAFCTGAIANFKGAAGHTKRTTHVGTLCCLISFLQCLHTRPVGIAEREGPCSDGMLYV